MGFDAKKFIIEKLISVLLSTLDKETIERALIKILVEGKDLVDAVLDEAKAKIRESENTIDDQILLPIIEAAERVLGLPED